MIENDIFIPSSSKSSHGIIVWDKNGHSPVQESLVQAVKLEDFCKLKKKHLKEMIVLSHISSIFFDAFFWLNLP